MKTLVILTTLPSILSYLVISIPIFAGYYDNLNNGELTKAISNNSFVCMQLVWQVIPSMFLVEPIGRTVPQTTAKIPPLPLR